MFGPAMAFVSLIKHRFIHSSINIKNRNYKKKSLYSHFWGNNHCESIFLQGVRFWVNIMLN